MTQTKTIQNHWNRKSGNVIISYIKYLNQTYLFISKNRPQTISSIGAASAPMSLQFANNLQFPKKFVKKY